MVAQIPGPALPADALKRIDEVHASSPVQARVAIAVVDIFVTVYTRVTGIAYALAPAAFAPAPARHALTAAAKSVLTVLAVVGLRLRAVPALPIGRAMAVVVHVRLVARGRVPAGVGVAVVPVDFALVARVAHRTDALVLVDEVATFAPVLARVGRALVNVDLAVLARVTGRARAVVVVDQVDAEGAMSALAHAVVYVLRAVLAREAASASAPGIGRRGFKLAQECLYGDASLMTHL